MKTFAFEISKTEDASEVAQKIAGTYDHNEQVWIHTDGSRSEPITSTVFLTDSQPVKLVDRKGDPYV